MPKLQDGDLDDIWESMSVEVLKDKFKDKPMQKKN